MSDNQVRDLTHPQPILLTETESKFSLSDVTIVLMPRGANAPRTQKWVRGITEDSSLSTSAVILWHGDASTGVAEVAVEGFDSVERLAMSKGHDGESVEDMERLLSQIKTTYIAMVTVTKFQKKTVSLLKKKVRKASRRIDSVDPAFPRALLLATATYPRPAVTSYLNSVMTGSQCPDDVFIQEYLGSLALSVAVGTVESVDAVSGEIQVFARLNFGALDVAEAPSWKFCVSLVSANGRTVESRPVALRQRTSMLGYVRWEYLTASIPVSKALTGEYRVVVSLDTEVSHLRVRRNLRPTVGVLLTARTVRSTVAGAAEDTSVQYLVHTTGDVTVTRLTVLRGGASGSNRAWSKVLFKKDLRLFAKGGASRQMRLLRLVRVLSVPLVGKRPIWLVGERVGTAQDNGFHLFKYLRKEHPKRRVYYVMDKGSSQCERVQPFGHVVEHSSLRHRLLMLHAAVLADAYSISYLVPKQWNRNQYARHLAWRIGALRVYLKHGVHMSPNAVKRGSTGYDMILTVAERETAALAEASGYNRQLTEVGLPRYDTLVPTSPSRTVLFMSTWRRYLVPKVFGGENKDQTPYEGSHYDVFMRSFLQSERLQNLLESYDYTLVFLPHHNLSSQFEGVDTGGSRVKIADTTTNTFQDLIRECDGFITDHSSVSFDIAYLGTPMIYARFDKDEFEDRHVAPSWFDHERDGFGPVTYNLEDTLGELEALLERDCAQDDFYTRRIDATFTYRDQSNCERTVSAIDALMAQTAG